MHNRELLLETCEDRILCDAAPDVTLTVPDKPKVGETVQVKATFDNTSATDTGFGPYIDLVIKHTGTDGTGDGSTAANAYDGLTFQNATYLGQNVTATVLTFDAAGHAIHPYAKDASGAPLVVDAPPGYGPGDQMIVLQLPYGSFSPSQPPADVLINLQMSNKADVNTPLNISARGGFQYGNDALDNSATDPSIIDPTYANASITPSLLSVSAVYVGPESETATGPNFTRQYQIVLDVANGQTLNNVRLVDVLAAAGIDAEQFAHLDSVQVNGATTTGYTLVSTPSTTTPGGTLDVLIPTLTGTNSTQDAVVTFSFYVPRVDSAGGQGNAAVINASSGDANIISNQAYGTGVWTPIDTRDAAITVSDKTTTPGGNTPDAASEHDLEAQSIAIQKGVTNVIRNGVSIGVVDADDYLPGDIVEFTINFQISDYFAFQNLTINDVMSDGLHLDLSSFSPTLSINGNTYTLGASAIGTDHYTQSVDTDGIYNNGIGTGDTTLNFDISAELAARASSITASTQAEIADKNYALLGQLLGGGVNPLNPNGNMANALSGYNSGPTTGQIVYRAVILDKYTDTAPGAPGAPSNEPSLNPRDQVSNSATISGSVLDLAAAAANPNNTDGNGANNVLTPTGNTQADDTGSLLSIHQDVVQKEIYAINGVLNGTAAFDAAFRTGGLATGAIHLEAGDDVTYRIHYTVPTGDVEHLRFTDYFPSPIYSVTDPDANGVPSGFTFVNNLASGNPTAYLPAAGEVAYGPSHTFNDVAGVAGGSVAYDSGTADEIQLSTDPTSNSLTFGVGTAVDPSNTSREVDLLVTVTVNSNAFADGLFLTNQVQSGERDTQLPGVTSEANSNAIVQIVLDQPNVSINKGVVASTQGGAAPTTGGLTFNGVGGNGFTGTLTGAANAAAIGALDLTTGTLPDAGDIVRFALVLQNTGNADAFDVSAQDTIRGSYINDYANATAFATATNFKVYSGNGTLLTLGTDYTLSWNNTTKTFSVTLNDTVSGQGKLNQGVDATAAGTPQTTDGSNAVVITYDLTVDTDASTGSTVTNTASLTQYTNQDGATGPGTNHAQQPLTESANVKINTPTFTKTLVGTEINTTGNNNTQAVIGELVTYTVTVTVPEGTTSGAKIVDILDPGLAFVAVTGVSASGGLSASLPTTGTTPANTTITNSGGTVTFNLGTITNSNTNNAQAETITITYTAVVLDTNTAPSTPGNQGGTQLNNSATFSSTHTDDNDTATSAVANAPITASAANVTIVEPTVTVSNSLSTDNVTYVDDGTVLAVAGQDVYYKVVLTNTSSVWANDISLYDRLPAVFDLANTSILSVTSSSGTSNFDTNAAGGFANFAIALDTAFGNNKPAFYTTGNLANLAPGETLTIVIKSRVVENAVAASTNPNGIQVRWTSMDDNVRSTDATDTTPTGITMGGNTTQVPRSIYNANSVERTGSDGPPTDPATGYFALNNYAATDDLTNTILQIVPVQLTKELLGTQINDATNSATQAVVGEYATYRITFAIPKGTTNNFVLTDVIDPGMAFADLVSVTGGPNVTTNVDGSGNPTANSIYAGNSAATNLANLQANTTITLNGTQVVINLGNVTNTEEPSVPGEFVAPQQIEIVYRVLVTNVTGNQAGAQHNNTATVDYDSIADTTPVHIRLSSTPATPVTIIEPALTISKQVTTSGPYDAGDSVQYSMVIQHSASSNTDAFDLSFSDPLSAFLVSAGSGAAFATSDLGASIVITQSGGVGDISSQFEVVGGVLRTKSTANVDLLKGQTITITVNGKLASNAQAGTLINNTATVNWTSIDGTPAVTSSYTTDDTERDGSNGPGGLNDYTASAAAGLTIADPTVDKQFKDGSLTSDDTSLASSTGANVVVGEQVTYDILVTLPEGVTRDVRVQDLIPAGMRIDSIQILTAAGSSGLLTNTFNGSFQTTPTLAAPATGAGTLSLDFDDITVAADNDAANNKFVVRVTATVLNVVGNQQGVTRTNTAQITFNDPDGAGNAGPAADRTITDSNAANDPTVTIAEPTVTVTKSVSSATPNPDAGDTLTYAITLSNLSSQTAYEVTLSDALSSNLSAASLFSLSTTGPVTGATLAAFEIVNVSGSLVLRTVAGANIDLSSGGTITLTYTATIGASVGPTSTVANTANVRWSSLDSGLDGDDAGTVNERNGSSYIDPAPTSFSQTTPVALNDYALSSTVVTTTTNSIAVNKTVVNTSLGGSDGVVTPGEIVTYQMTVTLPEGVAPNLRIRDNLPAGMAYVAGSTSLSTSSFNGTVGSLSVSPVSGSTFGDGTDLEFNFGAITTTADNNTTNNTFTFTYQAVVLDVAGNDGVLPGQTTLANSATQNNGGGMNFGTSAGSASVTVVEPNLAATSSVVVNGAGTSGDAGDPATYTTVVKPTANATSTAYDVTYSDPLPSQFTPNSATSFTVTDATLGDISGRFELVQVTPGNWTLRTVAGQSVDIAQGDQLTVVVDGVLNSTITPNQTVSNTASIAYTGYPGDRSSTGGFDPNSAVTTDHERTYTASGSANLTGATASFSKSLFSTDQAFTSGSNVAIGEQVTYALKVTLPEGTTPNLSILDELPAGLQYVPGSAVVVTTAAGSGGLLTSDFNGTISLPTVSGGGSDGADVSFSFGQITTTGDNTAGNNSFIVLITARVTNSLGNQSGTVLHNDAVFDISTDGLAATTTPNVDVTVVEPHVNVTKTVLSATNGIDAGDTVTYQVTLNNLAANGATADAFDVALSDVLPPGLTIASISAPTLSGGATQDIALNGVGGGTLGGQFDIPVGGSVTFTYTATVADTVTPNQTLTSDLNVSFSSLNGSVANERTGADVGNPEDNTPQNNNAVLNNYAVGVDTSIATANPFTVTKSLNNTSLGNDTSLNVVVGETLTYQLSIGVMEGTTNNLVFVDSLPRVAGVNQLTYVPGSFIVTNANGMTITGASVSYDSSTNKLTISFASVVNPGGSNGTTNDPAVAETDAFTVTYQAQVADVAANQAGTNLTNSVNGSATGVPPDNNNQITVNVHEPVLSLTKTTTTPGTDGGDNVVYTLVLSNTGNATAYDINIKDTLDTALQLATPGSALTITSGTTPYAILTQGGNTAAAVASILNQLNAGDSITITVNAQVKAGAVAGDTISNTASVDYSSLPGTQAGERTGGGGVDDYTTTASSADFTLSRPAIDKLTPADTTYSIGETVTYDILVTIPEGTTNNLVVTDNLPAGLVFTGAQIITSAAASGGLLSTDFAGTVTTTPTLGNPSGNVRTFDFGNVVATANNTAGDNTFVLRVTAYVDNISANQGAGSPGTATQFSNTATLQYTDGTTGSRTVTDPTTPGPITVVEPVMTFNKTVTSSTTGLDAGDTVTYQVTIANNGTATAQDVNFADTLPPGMIITTGSLNPAGGVTIDSAGGGAGTNGLTYQFTIPVGGTVTITYSAVLPVTVTPGQALTNDATLNWSSIDGPNSYERTGADGTQGGGTLNDYSLSSSVTVDVANPFSVTKTLSNTSLGDDTSTTVAVGEVLTYQLAVSVVEGTTTNLNLVDSLPPGLVYVPGSAVISNANGITVNGFTATYNPGTNQLALTASSVVNPGGSNGSTNDASTAETDTFLITYQVRVADVVTNQSGTTLTNNVSGTATGVPPDTNNPVTVTVQAPNLAIDKSFGGVVTGDAGDVVPVTIVVTNTGTGTAYDTVLSDVIDPAYFNSSFTLSSAPPGWLSNFNPGTNTLSFTDTNGTGLAVGASATFVFNVSLKNDLSPGLTAANTASAFTTTLPGVDANERTTPTVNDTATLTVPNVLTFTKSLQSTSNGATSGSNVAIGETATYRLQTTLEQGLTSRVTVQDALPAGLVYQDGTAIFRATTPGVSAVGVSSGTVYIDGSVINSADLVYNAGTGSLTLSLRDVQIPATAATTTGSFAIDYIALVANVPTNTSGTTLTNTAHVSADRNGDGDNVDAGETSLNSSQTLTIVEPTLSIDKTFNVASGDAGNLVQMTIVVTNTGTGPAFDTVLSDTINGAQFNLLTFNPVIAPAGWSGSFNTTTGLLSLTDTNAAGLAAGASATFVFEATLRTDLAPGVIVSNTASAHTTTAPGIDPNDRTEPTVSSTAILTAPSALSVAKTLQSTGSPTTTGSDVAIGETADFRLAVTLEQGQTQVVSINDTLPVGEGYDAGTAIFRAVTPGATAVGAVSNIVYTDGAVINAADVIYDAGTGALSFSLKNVQIPATASSGTGQFAVDYRVRVQDVASNQSGTTLTNSVTVRADLNGDGDTTDAGETAAPATQTLNVIEPSLDITKTFNVTQANAGDTIQVTIAVTNNGTAAAFNSVISDTINGVQFDRATFAEGTMPGGWSMAYDSSTGQLTYTNTNPAGLAAGATATFTFNIDLASALPPGAVVSNTATATTTTLPGTVAGERSEAPVSDTATLNSLATVALDKTVQSTSDAGTTGNNVTIGEVATYQLTVTLGEGVTSLVTFNDSLPAGIGYDAGSAIFRAVTPGATVVGAVSGLTYTDGMAINAADIVSNPGTGALSFSFVNAMIPAGTTTGTGQFAVEYQATVQDVGSNSGGVALTNSATVSVDLNDDGDADDAGETSAPASQTLTVVEPSLVVTKVSDDADGIVSRGQLVTYTLTVSHTAGSDATAYDVAIDDVVPTGMTLVGGSLSINPTAGVTGAIAAINGATIGIAVDSMDVGSTVTITFQAYVDTATAPGAVIDNNARIYWDSLPANDTNTVRDGGTDGTPDRDYGAKPGVEAPTANTDPAQDTERVTVGTGSIGDFVWLDTNGDGIQNPLEKGIGGVTVFADLNDDGIQDATEPSAVTDVNGAYTITGLAPGTYTIRVLGSTLPAGVTETYDLNGALDNAASVTLADGQTRTDADFGYQGSASVGDKVWVDLDGNGAQNGLEPGAEGVTVELLRDLNGDGDATDPGEGVIAQTTTDASGNYSFTGLIGGNYLVRVTDTGGVLTDATQTYDLDGLTTLNQTAVALTPTQNRTDADFGYQGASSIGDRVWDDLNGDGAQDPGEFGLTGVGVQLQQFIGGSYVTIATTTTGADGVYNFTGLLGDNYRVTITTPPASSTRTFDLDGAGTADTSLRTLGSNETATNVDFGYQGSASIGDYVWFDQNGDGVQAPGDPPLPGVRVFLDVDGDGVYTAGTDPFQTTDASGHYQFTGLVAGTYSVVVDQSTLPAGERISTFDRDSGTVAPDGKATVTLGATQAVSDADFGFQGQFIISGKSYQDQLKDGVQNGADTGLGGVLVTLIFDADHSGTISGGDAVIASTFTAADGSYEFDHLIVGDYVIKETQPTGFGEGTENGTDRAAVNVTTSTLVYTENFGNTTGSISGTVFSDSDDSGVQDGTETGLAGVDVTLEWSGADGVFGNADDRSVTVQTDANGQYKFDYTNTAGFLSDSGDTTSGLLSTGLYRITEKQPAGFVDGAETAGNAAVNAGGVDEGTHTGHDGRGADQIGVDGNYIQIGDAQDATGYTFGELKASSIAGSVFIDSNNDGKRQPGEKGLANVTVTLTGINDLGDAISLTTKTDAEGHYQFDTLRPGTYMVHETQPTGVNDGNETAGTAGGGVVANDVLGNIALGIGTDATAYDFGETEIPPVVPPPSPQSDIPPFAFDSFHNFASDSNAHEGRPTIYGWVSSEGTHWPGSVSSPDVYGPPLLPIEPIYSGAANPGATLVIDLYNSQGVKIGSQTVVADAGGNWLANFSSTQMRDMPSEVRVTQTAAPYSVGTPGGANFRVYYTPSAINPGHFVGSAATNLLSDDPAPLLSGLNLANPIQFGPVKYGGEFLSTEGTASGQ